MENFEYSIQLNDRDWAEFYLASEECSVIPAALATAEEQLQSDLEEGEVQEDRLIRVRVGPVPAPSTASCPPRGAPGGHLLAEEVLSGSEDETELGSVSRFLCGNSQPGAALPRPSAIQGSQQPPVTSRPLGGQHELLELARECEALFASEERESESGGWLGDSNHSLPVVDVAVPKTDFRGQISGQEAMEKSACSESMVVGASKGIDRQAEVHGRRPERPTNDISQTTAVDVQLPLLAGNNGEIPESLALKDLSEHPTSSSFPSADYEEAELPEKSTKHLQVHLKAEVPSFKEKSSRLQGNSVPLVGALAPSDPQSENHEQGGLERKSNEEEVAVNHKDEGRADQSEFLAHGILKEVSQGNQEISSAGCAVNLQKFPGELGANKCPQLTMVTNSRSSGTLDQQRETDALKGEIQKDSIEEPCHHLGTAGPSKRESLSTAQGSQRSNLLEGNIPFCPALENSLESNLTTMTWPETYEYFFCDNPQEQAEKMQEQASEERQVPVIGQDLPEMSGPEMYEYFFTNMEGAWVGESGKGKELRLETFKSSDQPLAPPAGSQDSGSIVAEDATYISVPDVYEHFFNNGAQDRKSWKRLFLSMPASEARKAMRALKSLLSKPAQLLRSHPTSPETLLQRGSHGKVVVFSPRLQEESQPRPKDLRTAVMSPERPLRLTLTHREMCLGFVAFASWAVKTSNLQAPDAWKIVFLANFGTLSAIRYFRRQVAAEGQHST